MWWLFVLVLFLILFSFYIFKLNKDYYILSLCKRIKTIDGSRLEDKVAVIPGKTIFGNNFDMLSMTPEKIFNYGRSCAKYGRGKSYLLHFVIGPVYNITTAEEAEEIFQSSRIITKGLLYDLLKPFLGEGLLISTDRKWHFRRKILTPAFHFNVLQGFNEIFIDESLRLLKKLKELGESPQIDVADIIAQFTLNNVCETALGVSLENVSGSSKYRKAIHDCETIVLERMSNPLMLYNWVFYFFGEFRKQNDSIKIAHDFSSKIIEKKRREYQTKPKESKEKNEFGLKKRYAMLDTLLEVEAQGLIDHQGICDEVNTFMFEGYDTTSTCLIFTILNLSLYPEVQKKCREELQDIADFKSMTVFDFNKLEYLECVLKETLRLFPAVHYISRKCMQNTIVNGLFLPKGTEVNIHIYDIMRDERHFAQPDNFKPERFLSEESEHKNPFAFVPFSAGSRNCIGQKFAIIEMKAVIVAILKEFEILPITKLEELTFTSGLVLRTKQKIYVNLKKINN